MPDITGRYDIRTVARLHHEGDCDTSIADALGVASPHTEDAEEVMDPDGNTVAYFVMPGLAERFCHWMNTVDERTDP